MIENDRKVVQSYTLKPDNAELIKAISEKTERSASWVVDRLIEQHGPQMLKTATL